MMETAVGMAEAMFLLAFGASMGAAITRRQTRKHANTKHKESTNDERSTA